MEVPFLCICKLDLSLQTSGRREYIVLALRVNVPNIYLELLVMMVTNIYAKLQ